MNPVPAESWSTKFFAMYIGLYLMSLNWFATSVYQRSVVSCFDWFVAVQWEDVVRPTQTDDALLQIVHKCLVLVRTRSQVWTLKFTRKTFCSQKTYCCYVYDAFVMWRHSYQVTDHWGEVTVSTSAVQHSDSARRFLFLLFYRGVRYPSLAVSAWSRYLVSLQYKTSLVTLTHQAGLSRATWLHQKQD